MLRWPDNGKKKVRKQAQAELEDGATQMLKSFQLKLSYLYSKIPFILGLMVHEGFQAIGTFVR